MIKKKYGSFPHFQEDSNILKYVLFGYYMNKLWIFEVSITPSPKTWVCILKLWSNMIYNCCAFLDYYSFSPLQAYFLPTHRNGEVPVLWKYLIVENPEFISGTSTLPMDKHASVHGSLVMQPVTSYQDKAWTMPHQLPKPHVANAPFKVGQ
jgi:hypothetical protein